MSSREELYYIWNGDYAYNGFVWWGENKNGYTAYLQNAGKYTREEAYSITKNRESDLAIPVSVIDESKAKFTIADAQYIDRNQFLNFDKLEPPQPAPVSQEDFKAKWDAMVHGNTMVNYMQGGEEMPFIALDTLNEFMDSFQPADPKPFQGGQITPGRFVPESQIQKLRDVFSVSKSYMRLDGAVHAFLQAIEKGGSENA